MFNFELLSKLMGRMRDMLPTQRHLYSILWAKYSDQAQLYNQLSYISCPFPSYRDWDAIQYKNIRAVGKITFIMYVYSKRFRLVILAVERETDQRVTYSSTGNIKKKFK